MLEPWRKAIIVFDAKKENKNTPLQKFKEQLDPPQIEGVSRWKNKKHRKIEVTLLCSNCMSWLVKKRNSFICSKCNLEFIISEGEHETTRTN